MYLVYFNRGVAMCLPRLGLSELDVGSCRRKGTFLDISKLRKGPLYSSLVTKKRPNYRLVLSKPRLYFVLPWPFVPV